MDYKELVDRLKSPTWQDLEDPDSSLLTDAATAITDLLARAEAAEARAENAERERDEKTPKEVLEAIDELVEFARERMSMVDWLYYANVIGAWRGQKED